MFVCVFAGMLVLLLEFVLVLVLVCVCSENRRCARRSQLALVATTCLFTALCQCACLSCRLSVFGFRLSAVGCRPSTVGGGALENRLLV